MGAKIEHNAFTGRELEPSASLAWAINDRQALWISAAKATREPSIIDENLKADSVSFPLPTGVLGVVRVLGSPNFQSEEVRDYEIGYRAQPHPRFSLDLVSFYSFYRQLRTIEPEAPFFELSPAPPHVVLPQVFMNKMHGQDYGAEASLNWSVLPRWKLSGGYSWLKMNLYADPSSLDTTSAAADRQSPRHQFNVRSYLNLTRNWSFDNSLYYVGSLPAYQVPSYYRLDSRLAWHVGESVELSVVGQNLLNPRRFEFGNNDLVIATQPERSVFGRVTWSF